MSLTSEQFLYCLCRTCMQEVVEGNSLQSIYNTIEECASMRIEELLTKAIPQMEVQVDDKLPQKICDKCLTQLMSVNRFQQMCLQSQQQMRELIAKRGAESTEAAIKDDMNTNIYLKQEVILDANEPRIELAPMDALPETNEAPQSVDPLQNIDVVMEHGKDESSETSMHVENDQSEEDMEDKAMTEETDEEDDRFDKEQLPSAPKAKPDTKSKKRVCDECGKVYYKATSLRTHRRRCHSTVPIKKPTRDTIKTPLPCNMCNETCNGRAELKKHKELMHFIKKTLKSEYPCDLCNEVYKTHSEILHHKKVSHSTAESLHPCYICNKNFKIRKALRLHLRRHKGERLFLCTECGKSFADASGLRQHRFRHAGDKAYECPHCPARFFCPNDVANHKVVHEEIKRHVCDICGYKFSTSSQLVMHKKWHNNDRPHKCDCCEKRFVRKTALRRHMLSHTGEKPYKCKYCGRAYSQNNDLMKHLCTHLGANVYRCKICPLAFPTGKECRLHFPTHKNEDEETRERNMKALMEEEAKLLLKFAELPKEPRKPRKQVKKKIPKEKIPE